MSDYEDEGQWYFSVTDGSVSQGKETHSLDRMGPYPDRESAERALQSAAERNVLADSEDERWDE